MPPRKCVECGLKQSSFALPGEKSAQWCAKCAAEKHPGAVDVRHARCSECGLKQPSFALPGETSPQWCAKCAKKHLGAVDVAGTARCNLDDIVMDGQQTRREVAARRVAELAAYFRPGKSVELRYDTLPVRNEAFIVLICLHTLYTVLCGHVPFVS